MAALVASLLNPGGAGAVAEAASYSNPVVAADFPDPFVLRDGPLYFAYATSALGSNIQVVKSRDLAAWVSVTNEALPVLPAWAGWPDVWAPTVLSRDGTYVLYYSVRERASGHMCVSRAIAGHPAGPFRDTSTEPMVCDRRRGGTIDPSPFVDGGGVAWLLYKTEGTASHEPPRIWVQRLGPDGLTVTGRAVPLLAPDRAWEGHVVEAPAMVRQGHRYHLFYSGNGWWRAAYAVGHAVCESVTGPCHKTSAHPVLRSGGEVAGPGGQELFTDERGRLWMAYHGWDADAVGYPHGARSMRLDPVLFWDGAPVVFGPSEGRRPLHGIPDHPATALLPDAAGHGYGVVTTDGDVFVHGTRRFAGSAADSGEWHPFVDAASANSGDGYWMVTTAGTVAAFGDALHHGDLSGRPGPRDVVAVIPGTPGVGYRLVTGAGRVMTFGDATHHGDLGTREAPAAAPVVDAAAAPDGRGYWLVDRLGRVSGFGNAVGIGDLGHRYLHQPLVAVAATPTGFGYWLVDRAGTVWAFGDATHHGDLRGRSIAYPVVDIVPLPAGGGYWLLTNDGRVHPFGGARQHGWTALPGR